MVTNPFSKQPGTTDALSYFDRKSAGAPRTVADDRHLQKTNRRKLFWHQLHRMRPPPQIPEWERVARTVGRHVEAVIRGNATVDEALTALDADVDRMLEKRRWLLSGAK